MVFAFDPRSNEIQIQGQGISMLMLLPQVPLAPHSSLKTNLAILSKHHMILFTMFLKGFLLLGESFQSDSLIILTIFSFVFCRSNPLPDSTPEDSLESHSPPSFLNPESSKHLALRMVRPVSLSVMLPTMQSLKQKPTVCKHGRVSVTFKFSQHPPFLLLSQSVLEGRPAPQRRHLKLRKGG